MNLKEIVKQIELIRENYVNGNIDGDDMSEYLEDLCSEIKHSADSFTFFDDDDHHHESFKETDFSDLHTDE